MTGQAALLALALGFAPAPAVAQDSISYELGPCFGRCAAYRFTVQPSGAGIFEGRGGSAVAGRHPFRASRAQYRAFAALLAPVRPARGNVDYSDAAHCRHIITDQATLTIVWRGPGGQSRQLSFDYGCEDPRNADLVARLGRAPGLLPLRDLIRAGRR